MLRPDFSKEISQNNKTPFYFTFFIFKTIIYSWDFVSSGLLLPGFVVKQRFTLADINGHSLLGARPLGGCRNEVAEKLANTAANLIWAPLFCGISHYCASQAIGAWARD